MNQIYPIDDKLRAGIGLPVIQSGELFVFPTETVYGLGTMLGDPAGIEAIFRLKGRGDEKPLALYLSDPEQLADWVIIDERTRRLADHFLPGPLTLVLRSLKPLPARVGTIETIGIRIPDHPIPRLLIQQSGQPFVATSANFSGDPSPIDFSDIPEEFLRHVNHAFADGTPGSGQATAVVDLTGETPMILRAGELDLMTLQAVLD